MGNILIKPQEVRTSRRVTCDCKSAFDCTNELCNTHTCNYLAGVNEPNYPVPALHLKTIPVFLDGECIAIDIVDTGRDSHWPIVAGFDKY